MIEQAARTTIWSVDGADEAPSFGQELANRGGFHFSEVLTTVDAAEMRQVAREVELVSHNRKTSCLLKIKLGASH